MKKNLKTLVMMGLLALSPISLASCSFFNTSDAVVNIQNIDVKTNENGDTVITIYYTDVNKDPTSFTIPKGNDGKEGVGIENISYEDILSEDGSELLGTRITIHFTDPSREDVTFDVLNGEGKKGDPGNGIFEITSEHSDEEGATIITITFTDDNYQPLTLKIPDGKQGEPGLSVGSISSESSADGTETYISFFDQYGDPIGSPISIPRANTWLSGMEEPGRDVGNDGDFYFETTHYYVYQKVGGAWQKVAELGAAKQDKTYYTVNFDVNDANGTSAHLISGQTMYEIEEGKNFYAAGYDLPFAYREGYTFGGWLTSRTYNVTLGLFTNVTPVYRSTTLYAYWIAA